MVYFLYGIDTYRRNKRRAEIIASFKERAPRGAVEQFDLSTEVSFEALREFIRNQSLFAPLKLAVAELGDELPEGLREMLQSMLTNRDAILVLLSQSKPPKPLAFLLKAPVTSELFEPLEGASLATFITEEARVRGAKIAKADADAIARISAGSSAYIVQELEKVALGSTVEHGAPTPAFFSLVQVLRGRGGVGAKLTALAHLLEQEDPAAVFNITASIADSRLKPQMANYDLAVKSGKLEYEEALLDFILASS